MIRIEVHTAEVRTQSGNRKSDGKPYSIRKQEAWAHIYTPGGNKAPYPVRVELSLEDQQSAYQPGDYVLAPQSIYIDKFGGFETGRPQLMAVSEFLHKITNDLKLPAKQAA